MTGIKGSDRQDLYVGKKVHKVIMIGQEEVASLQGIDREDLVLDDEVLKVYVEGDTPATGTVELVDSLVSTRTDAALTANQGRVLNEKVEQAFQAGNSAKANVVGALLSLDPTLPITVDSTWAQLSEAITSLTVSGESINPALYDSKLIDLVTVFFASRETQVTISTEHIVPYLKWAGTTHTDLNIYAVVKLGIYVYMVGTTGTTLVVNPVTKTISSNGVIWTADINTAANAGNIIADRNRGSLIDWSAQPTELVEVYRYSRI